MILQTIITPSPELKAKLQELADKEKRSLNKMILYILEAYLEQKIQ